MAVQNAFNVNPEVGYLGQCSRPGSPKATEAGVLSVPSGATRIPRPGDALFWHATSDAWRIPTSAAQSLLVTALLTYRVDTVQGADSILQFVDGAEIEVATMGFYFVQAGNAIEPQSNVHWDRSRTTSTTPLPARPLSRTCCLCRLPIMAGRRRLTRTSSKFRWALGGSFNA